MQFPLSLLQAIQELAMEFSLSELTRASAELSGAYRQARKDRPHLDSIHRAAYLLTRMPATYSVLARILRECKVRIPDLRVGSMLDLGAGPGTALWAAIGSFPELTESVLLEDDREWIRLGKRLAQKSDATALRSAEWLQKNVGTQLPARRFDLVTISYVLNELRSADVAQVVRAAWQGTGKLLVIVEPGTPSGFALIRELRDQLIATGGYIAAPCPHAELCPMLGNDWCHFSERLQRSSEHRLAKGAELGYEDEKFSYVVFSRQEGSLPAARIVRHPRRHSGHVDLELCTPSGLRREVVTRKQGHQYRVARKANWGDEF